MSARATIPAPSPTRAARIHRLRPRRRAAMGPTFESALASATASGRAGEALIRRICAPRSDLTDATRARSGRLVLPPFGQVGEPELHDALDERRVADPSGLCGVGEVLAFAEV